MTNPLNDNVVTQILQKFSQQLAVIEKFVAKVNSAKRHEEVVKS